MSSKGKATAPASSGNLGPGFDVLAVALELRCTCEAEPSDRWVIEEEGSAYEPAPGDLVVRAMRGMVGDRPVRVRIDNAVPRSRGLGSSSAVTTAAAAAAFRAYGEEPGDSALFELVTGLEGHPDNAAAAVYGGLVAASGGVVRHLPLAPHLRIVVGIPDTHLSTTLARNALPAAVRRPVAARSIARLTMLLEGLRTGDAAALAAAAGDELHEKPRANLSPVTGRLMDAARDAGALHAAWSGAGPTALALVTDETRPDVEIAMQKVLDGTGEVRSLEVATGWT